MSRIRNVGFILLGVAGLVLKRHYRGPLAEVVLSYGGNVAVSFAVYWWVALLPIPGRLGVLATAGLAWAAVGAFEATNGFGVMRNVYDPLDFAANAVGVAVALGVDAALRRR